MVPIRSAFVWQHADVSTRPVKKNRHRKLLQYRTGRAQCSRIPPPPHLAETKNINSDKSASDLVPAAVITFNAGASLSSVLSVTF